MLLVAQKHQSNSSWILKFKTGILGIRCLIIPFILIGTVGFYRATWHCLANWRSLLK
jgi:hypothetical protein